MLHNKFLQSITAILLFAISFTACKKDAFSEKDAIAAQTTLLQQKFDNEKSMEQLRQQGILANTQLTFQLTLQNQLAANRNLDSLQRAYKRFSDSIALVTNRNIDSVTARSARLSDIVIQVSEISGLGLPVSGATVTLPTSVGTVLQATTDASGIAFFPAINNINVPFYVQAIVSKTGWVTATSFIVRSPASASSPTTLTATVGLWNNTNLRNRVSGTVTIETDLINASAEVVSGQLITLSNTLNGIRYFFSATTNASGVYSINLPDVAGTVFSFLAVTKDSTSRLYVNALAGGVDSIPSIQTVAARFTLGARILSSGILPTNALSSIPTPSSVPRYHAVVDQTDSSGRTYYFKGLNMTQIADPNTQLPYYYPNSSNTGALARVVNADGSDGNFFSPRFAVPAGTTTSGAGSFSTLPARYVDLLNNADGLFTTVPFGLELRLQFFNQTGFPQNNGWMVPTGTNTNIGFRTVFPTRSTAVGNINGFDPAALGIGNGNISFSNANAALQNRTSVTNNNGNFNSVNVQNGQTLTVPLSFGSGALLAGVR